MDRTDAIQALQLHGFVARERTWALGDSIFVGALPISAGDITGHRVGTYIYPAKEGRWAVIVDSRVPNLIPHQECLSLSDAVNCAVAFMRSEIARVTPM